MCRRSGFSPPYAGAPNPTIRNPYCLLIFASQMSLLDVQRVHGLDRLNSSDREGQTEKPNVGLYEQDGLLSLCPYPGPTGHMTVCQNYNNGNITPKTHSTKSRDIDLRPIFQSHTAMFFFREQTLTVKTR